MNDPPRALALLHHHLAVCRLAGDDTIPSWAIQGRFWSITRTPDELSIVCDESALTRGLQAERPWRALRVAGVIDFSVVGVLARLSTTLAQAGISLLAVSTYATDYLLIKEHDLARAREALTNDGYSIVEADRLELGADPLICQADEHSLP